MRLKSKAEVEIDEIVDKFEYSCDKPTDSELHKLFHSLWSNAVDAKDYNKRGWRAFSSMLTNLGIKL